MLPGARYSISMSNRRLNAAGSLTRVSGLGGPEMTIFPSCRAAAKVRSHSSCQSALAAGDAAGEAAALAAGEADGEGAWVEEVAFGAAGAAVDCVSGLADAGEGGGAVAVVPHAAISDVLASPRPARLRKRRREIGNERRSIFWSNELSLKAGRCPTVLRIPGPHRPRPARRRVSRGSVATTASANPSPVASTRVKTRSAASVSPLRL